MTGTFSPSKRSMEQVYVSLPVAALDLAGTRGEEEDHACETAKPCGCQMEEFGSCVTIGVRVTTFGHHTNAIPCSCICNWVLSPWCDNSIRVISPPTCDFCHN